GGFVLLRHLRWAVAFSLTVTLTSRGEDLAARVVVLANARDHESIALGEFYASQRGIPRVNVIYLPMPEAESITWREFVDQVWQPLQDELLRLRWLDGIAGSSLDAIGRKRVAITGHHIAYLVVCRGTPLRIVNDPAQTDDVQFRKVPPQFQTNQGSVDSELSLLAAGNYPTVAFVPNPWFNQLKPIDVDAALVVKVARLDGPTYADARHLVTSALEGERSGLMGRYYVDLGGGPHPDGDAWLDATQKELEALGFDGDVERSGATFAATARFDAPVLYFGWYAQNANGPFVRDGFAFAPGAIALHIHSFSAETLHSTTTGWCGPFVAHGAAATVGNVFEPYLNLTHRPDLLLQALARGDTLGDAAYFALPVLSWQAVLIGDPLYRPFQVTLDQQIANLSHLPADCAGYAVVRKSVLLERAGKSDEAIALLQSAARLYPDSKEIAGELEKLTNAAK
ncbi:MAG TPA: TIGR03790 family protein, partial [Candidatus Didemnitutus sp.]|nr:TIGR03790 family protein [Candidatus Didemnitutus sp.]